MDGGAEQGAVRDGHVGASWAAVVEADARLSDALAAIPVDELPRALSRALEDFSSRPTALRILGSAHSRLTLPVLPTLEPLLLVSHSALAQCRGLVLRLPSQKRLDFLDGLTSRVLDSTESDGEAYRRLAELLQEARATDDLSVLLAGAAASDDAEVREVAEDFSTPKSQMMSGRPAPLDLSEAEMLVLFDWLSRSREAGAPVIDLDEAERRVLWDLDSALEARLAAPLSEHYGALLQQARDDVLGR